MDASWSGLGELLERSRTALGPKKSPLDRLLAAPVGFPKGFSHLEGQKAPKGGAQTVQNRVQNRVRREKGEITKQTQYISRENLNFEGPGPPNTGPTSVPNLIFFRGSPRQAS